MPLPQPGCAVLIPVVKIWILRSSLDRRQNHERGVHDSLSPSEEERVWVKGKSLAAIAAFPAPRFHPPPHPDRLPLRGGEGNVGYPAALAASFRFRERWWGRVKFYANER